MENILEFITIIAFILFIITLIINVFLCLKGKLDHWKYSAKLAIFTSVLCCILILFF